MQQVVIENPVLNSPFEEPKRHFRFSEDGITNEIIEERRISQYFVPIPRAKKKSPKQLSFETEWTADRVEENKGINRIRERVAIWRKGGHVGITKTTARLLEHWKREDRERRLFFCQIEALETAIWITEVAPKYGEAWVENLLRDKNAQSNPLLFRIAFKMATGSGKTVVMAMLIAWQALNKFANSQDARFSDTFLIVTPGITIKDRLRVLLPNNPQSYYKQHDIIPSDLLPELDKAKFVITNFHAFKLRERVSAGKLTKQLLKKTGAGNLFMIFSKPDVEIRRGESPTRPITVKLNGLDVYDPTTGDIRSNSTDDIACWFLDTDYNDESFIVRHAYFNGADEPYDKLKLALLAEIDESAWSVLYTNTSVPFEKPSTGKIAVKVINHYGDEVLKVFEV